MSDDNFVAVDIESKKFDNKVVFSKLKFSMKEGEIISIFGPSGCGKTTLLNDCWIRGI
ncbi:MAG: ATP-binding cassette domain-containing protein [Candidatus Poseidoniaceae archaeon]